MDNKYPFPDKSFNNLTEEEKENIPKEDI